jgi:hypothetical protein
LIHKRIEDLIELKKLSEMQDLPLLQDCINSKHAPLYKELDNVYGGAPKGHGHHHPI